MPWLEMDVWAFNNFCKPESWKTRFAFRTQLNFLRSSLNLIENSKKAQSSQKSSDLIPNRLFFNLLIRAKSHLHEKNWHQSGLDCIARCRKNSQCNCVKYCTKIVFENYLLDYIPEELIFRNQLRVLYSNRIHVLGKNFDNRTTVTKWRS